MKIGFITAADLSRYFPAANDVLFTHDDVVAKHALSTRGHEVDPVVWGSSPETLRQYDRLVVRSPWDYMDSDEKRKGLFKWLAQVSDLGIALENEIHWLLWNSDKTYLTDLADEGVTIVPTEFIVAGEDKDNRWLQSYFATHGPFVLKPTISAAAKDTFLINSSDIEKNLHALNGRVDGDFGAWRADRTFMLQPFLQEIRTRGEWSLVFFRGCYSHAVHKHPAQGQWLVQDELGGSVMSGEPPQNVLAVCVKAAATLPVILQKRISLPQGHRLKSMHDQPLYMRIDVIEAEQGPLVSEIEMIEPELFFLKRCPDGTKIVNTEGVSAFISALEA